MINSEISNLAVSAGTTKARTVIAMPEFNKENVLASVKEWLKTNDTTVVELAKYANVGKSTIYAFLNGDNISKENQIALIEAIGYKISYDKKR